MIIVPASFMQNEFWEKSRVSRVNEDFSFIGQTRLSPHAFTSVGVDNFNTKIMVFLRRSQHIEMTPYNTDEFVSMAELKERVKRAREMKHRLRLDLMRETNRIDKEELEHFEYKLAKYMYELKAHKRLNKHIDKATALVTIRKYITSQNVIPRKEIALVKTSYGFKLKQYAPRLLDKTEHRSASVNNLILGHSKLPMPESVTEENIKQIRAAHKIIHRKQLEHIIQNQIFSDMQTEDSFAEYLDNASFMNKDGERCEFTRLQKHDINLVLQKKYALLNWQQGSGKTAAVYHRAKYLLKYGKVRNVIILSPAIATNMTWAPFLSVNKEQYQVIRTYKDIENVPKGIFLLISTSMVGKLKRDLMRFVKLSSRKLCLIFDESDEITNPSSQRTRHILSVFRRLKYKILDTGTTTRNNIAELYSQLNCYIIIQSI